jgi:hypothetical protein
MTAYSLTKWSQKGDYDSVLAAMETQLETVANDKTIYLCEIVNRGNEFVGLLLYAT